MIHIAEDRDVEINLLESEDELKLVNDPEINSVITALIYSFERYNAKQIYMSFDYDDVKVQIESTMEYMAQLLDTDIDYNDEGFVFYLD